MDPKALVYFGSSPPKAPAGLIRRKGIGALVKAADAGVLQGLVVDARTPDDAFRAHALLRALYDDPRRPRRVLHPHRVWALIADGDVDTAFALGRFGIAGALEARAIGTLPARLAQSIAGQLDTLPLTTPAFAPPRATHLGARGEGEAPTVTIGYRHAPAMLEALERYQRALRRHARRSTVFADVATLIEVMVRDGLSVQTNLAAKAGATHTGQFIGSFDFYRELRKTRYAHIPDHPTGAIAMEVFIGVDEVLHEVLHLLFLANELRADALATNTYIAEEISITWWQGVVHNCVFPEWIADRHILEINDDFMLSEAHQETRGFWRVGAVFARYAGYPWIPYVLARLPRRSSYIGQRADLSEVIAVYATRSDAAFLVPNARERLAIAGGFDAYPAVPATLRLAAAAT